MPGKRIKDLIALSGPSTANDDDLVIFDTNADETKRISRSQLAIGLVGDLPYTPSGGIAATTVPTAIAELDSEAAKSATLAAAGGAALIGNTPAGTIAATTVQGAINEIVADLAAAGGAALVGNTPAGAIAATTVQAAINELDTEKQPIDAGLTSIAGLTTAADNMIYTTAADTYAVASLTAAGRAILDDADTAAQRVTLGLEIGVNVQAFDADTAKYDDVTANFTGVLQNGGSDVVVDTDIGVTVQAFDADTAKTDVAQTFTAQQVVTSGLVLQSVAAAAIAAVGDAINTADKVQGKVVYDTTNNRLMVASGAAAADAWYVADGSASVVPA